MNTQKTDAGSEYIFMKVNLILTSTNNKILAPLGGSKNPRWSYIIGLSIPRQSLITMKFLFLFFYGIYGISTRAKFFFKHHSILINTKPTDQKPPSNELKISKAKKLCSVQSCRKCQKMVFGGIKIGKTRTCKLLLKLPGCCPMQKLRHKFWSVGQFVLKLWNYFSLRFSGIN